MKKRKRYNPHKTGIDINAAFNAINLSKPVTDNAKAQLDVGIRSALLMFSKGMAQPCHFDTLASTVDLTMMLSNNLFEGAHIDEINKAREGMLRCRKRYADMGKLGLDGEGLQAIKFVIDLHYEQLNHVTGAEVLSYMQKRSQHIKSGNFFKG